MAEGFLALSTNWPLILIPCVSLDKPFNFTVSWFLLILNLKICTKLIFTGKIMLNIYINLWEPKKTDSMGKY